MRPFMTEALEAIADRFHPREGIKAIRSLGTRPNLPEVSSGATRYAKEETWKRGLTWAYRLLADSDLTEGPDHLYEVLESGDERRELLALSALTHARKNVRSRSLA